jgi:hypothetical protein
MPSLWIVLLGVAAIAVVLFVRNHRRWLAMQSPVGTWAASDGSRKIILSFEGGPHTGTYRQLEEIEGDKWREYGSWVANLSRLNMLILASERKDHPRVGVDTAYLLRYVGPRTIAIDGPDRQSLILDRATDDLLENAGF